MLPVRMIEPFQNCGLFGAKRKFDIHTGLDLYCEDGAEVVNLNDGIVVDVFTFTGEDVGTPWWNTTQGVVVECGSITYVYGEVVAMVDIGDKLYTGDIIGKATPVLRENKGKTPQCMLHLEVWRTEGYIKNATWSLDDQQPLYVCNPIMLIRCESSVLWLIKTKCGYMIQANDGSHLQFFTMAADSKAFLFDLEYKYLQKSSPLEDKIMYTLCTGKTLWFDNKY